jgi:hypothetical protein
MSSPKLLEPQIMRSLAGKRPHASSCVNSRLAETKNPEHGGLRRDHSSSPHRHDFVVRGRQPREVVREPRTTKEDKKHRLGEDFVLPKRIKIPEIRPR